MCNDYSKQLKAAVFQGHMTLHTDRSFLIIKPTRCTNFSNLFSE